jgi:hypothetical protein
MCSALRLYQSNLTGPLPTSLSVLTSLVYVTVSLRVDARGYKFTSDAMY